jgi:hypothetical protein
MEENIEDKLNQVSSGFCLASWVQTSISLPTGITRVCGLPNPTKISVDEIMSDDNALFNSSIRKKIRREMLFGSKPIECKFCWDMEKEGVCKSERVNKSEQNWALPYFDEIVTSGAENNFFPKYLEVGLSNTCNFKCLYCTLEYSSSWHDEIVTYGGIGGYNSIEHLIYNNILPISNDKENPYLQAFWRLWPELYRNLDTFRLTGGEPLLSDGIWYILDYIIQQETPNTNLTFSINTNLSVGSTLINKLIDKLGIIINENRVKSVVIYASIDTWGPQSEYIRKGLNHQQFWDNVSNILTTLPNVSIVIMSTFSLLSLSGYGGLITKIHNLNVQFPSGNRSLGRSVFLDSHVLIDPNHLTVKLLPTEDKIKILQTYTNLDQSIIDDMLPSEIDRIKYIYEWSMLDLDPIKIDKQRKVFVDFIDEIDRRRGKYFIELFPEFENFYNTIKSKNV